MWMASNRVPGTSFDRRPLPYGRGLLHSREAQDRGGSVRCSSSFALCATWYVSAPRRSSVRHMFPILRVQSSVVRSVCPVFACGSAWASASSCAERRDRPAVFGIGCERARRRRGESGGVFGRGVFRGGVQEIPQRVPQGVGRRVYRAFRVRLRRGTNLALGEMEN